MCVYVLTSFSRASMGDSAVLDVSLCVCTCILEDACVCMCSLLLAVHQ